MTATRIDRSRREGHGGPIDLPSLTHDRQRLVDYLVGRGTTFRGDHCACPYHDDRTPSAGIYAGADGHWRFKCHAPSCRDLGGDLVDLMTRDGVEITPPPSARPSIAEATAGAKKSKKRHPTLEAAIAAAKWSTAQRVSQPVEQADVGPWRYRRADGTDSFAVVRFEIGEGKQFAQVTRDGDRWIVGGPGGPRVLYRLPEIVRSEGPVLIVEGEKCADLAAAIMPATTWSMGASSVAKTDWSPLAGREVWVWPDVGAERTVDEIAAILRGLDPTTVIRRIDHGLTGDGEDIEQWLEARDSQEPEALRQAIAGMAVDVGDQRFFAQRERLGAGMGVTETEAALPAPAAPADPFGDLGGTMSPGAMRERFSAPPESIIEGLLNRGEVASLVGSTKTWKTWLTIGLALAVATGSSYAGFSARKPQRVLVIDTELTPHWWQRRAWSIADAMGVDRALVEANLSVVSLRGRAEENVETIRGRVAKLARGHFGLVVLDGLYQLMLPDMEENSNDDQKRLFGHVIGMATDSDTSVIAIRHASKGNQSEKDVTDVGSGGGAAARASDLYAVIRPHREDKCVTFEAVARNINPIEPVALRFRFPLFARDESLDPADLRKSGARGDRQDAAERWPLHSRVEEVLSVDRWDTLAKLKEAAGAKGIPGGVNGAKEWLEEAVQNGLVEHEKRAHTNYYRRAVPPEALLAPMRAA